MALFFLAIRCIGFSVSVDLIISSVVRGAVNSVISKHLFPHDLGMFFLTLIFEASLPCCLRRKDVSLTSTAKCPVGLS